MKNKDFENDIDFYNLIYSGGMDLFEEKRINKKNVGIFAKSEKNNKNLKKIEEKTNINDKFAKNAMFLRSTMILN